MQKLKGLFVVIGVLCMLAACNFNSYPNEEYAEVTFQEIKNGVESGELIEVKEQKQIENIVNLLKEANWEDSEIEMSEEPEGKVTLVSESESITDNIYVWFETTNERTVLISEEQGEGELSKEKGSELKDLLYKK
ncbi:hypothetical protein NM897_17045 (plasmid) [Planococcus maritimus]|uniref:hypothetical protein n=1 Tax=Planococcus maritimus TaxID=192421 RepID=UPI003139A256